MLWQIFFDTPGLTVDVRGHPLRTDNRNRVRSAWQTAELCEALIVLVDAHRQIERYVCFTSSIRIY